MLAGYRNMKGTVGLRRATLQALYTGTPAGAVRLPPFTTQESKPESRRKQSDEGPRRVGERQGLQTGELVAVKTGMNPASRSARERRGVRPRELRPSIPGRRNVNRAASHVPVSGTLV
jgi:hypothetical protein